jgi:hypothetical protein
MLSPNKIRQIGGLQMEIFFQPSDILSREQMLPFAPVPLFSLTLPVDFLYTFHVNWTLQKTFTRH